MKKYVNFKGTITGNQYFLRPLIATIPLIIAGITAFCLGAHEGNSMMVAIFMVIPAAIFAGVVSLSSTHKRICAFWEERNSIILAWICIFVPYIGTALAMYLWFADATYPNGEIDE